MYVRTVEGEKNVVLLGLDRVLCTRCVLLRAGAGGPRTSAGFRVFSDANIATLKKME
jgi:hypothetical protein